MTIEDLVDDFLKNVHYNMTNIVMQLKIDLVPVMFHLVPLDLKEEVMSQNRCQRHHHHIWKDLSNLKHPVDVMLLRG